MTLVYGSVCSGIEAATVAWHPLGWKPAFFSEIEKFPRAVLQHHYPAVPLHGDFTTIQKGDYAAIDLLVGGTPCQAFSVAGLRKGFADERGNLTLEFIRLADRLRPQWLVWENVPGVLSQDRGRAFGAFLGGLAECGYGFAYRVLDAQYFGVPQRRRRVFVVGYLGDWRPAAAVLFERESLSGDSAPRREAGPSVAALTANGVGTCGADDNQGQAGHLIASTGAVSHCLNAGGMGRQDYESETLVTTPINKQMALRSSETSNTCREGIGIGEPGDPAFTLQAAHSHAVAVSLRGRDGGGTAELTEGSAPALRASQSGGDKPHVLTESLVPWAPQGLRVQSTAGTSPTLMSNPNGGMKLEPILTSAVRRLTPRECERLQGFPDDYTLVPTKTRRRIEVGELAYLRAMTDQQMAEMFGVDPETFTGVSDAELQRMAADGPRYKALGNSMAVPVMAWIGQRIEMVRNMQVAA